VSADLTPEALALHTRKRLEWLDAKGDAENGTYQRIAQIIRGHQAALDEARAEVADLRADLALTSRVQAARYRIERDAAEARLAAVRALHEDDDGWCAYDGSDYPCATIRALDGAT
jgi:hypothetical protein